ncbi:MAG: hypothetical protein Q9207_007191 [Kuettlingeria erythrocarpa]
MPSKRRRPLNKAKATIESLANEDTPSDSTPKAGQEAIDRVRKCFQRANHPNANEQEAKAASKMAAKIMERYKISQVDLMLDEAKSERQKRGGLSTVYIRPAKHGGRAFTPGWVDWLSSAVQIFFDCRAFFTHRSWVGADDRIQWTFYGIAEHTVSAAIAFEAIHNQIQDWSEAYVGIPLRNSYCLGVADGLLTLSRVEKKAAEAGAREAEEKAFAAKIREEDEKERERHLALDFDMKLGSESEDEMDIDNADEPSDTDGDAVAGAVDDGAMGNGAVGNGLNDAVVGNGTINGGADVSGTEDDEVLPDFTEGDEDETLVDTTADFDTELRKFIPPKRTKKAPAEPLPRPPLTNSTQTSGNGGEEVEAGEETAAWRSMRQLTQYREMSEDIAKNVVEERGIKLTNGRKLTTSIKNEDAFKKGQKDSKQIRLRAARIEKGDEPPKEFVAQKRSTPSTAPHKPRVEKKRTYQAELMDIDE